MRIRFLFFVLILSVFNLAYAAEGACTEIDKKGIEHSIKIYLNDAKNSALKYKDVTLLSKTCVNGYAKVIVHPKKPVSDNAIAYLQKEKGDWSVLSLGTFFEPDFLAKLPKELR